MPLGMMINFQGETRAAVTRYAEIFGQPQPFFLTYGESDTSYDPNFTPSEQMKDWVMSTVLTIEGMVIEFSDMPDAFELVRGNSHFLNVVYQNQETASQVFEALAQEGALSVPFGQIAENMYYGMVTDRYGLNWIIKANT